MTTDQIEEPFRRGKEGFSFVSVPKLEPGPKTVKPKVRDRPPGLGHGTGGKKVYFFLVVDFLVVFFPDDFLAVVFLAMALDLLSVTQM